MNSKKCAKIGKRQDPIQGRVEPSNAMLRDERASLHLVDGLVREDVAPMELKSSGSIGKEGGRGAVVGDDVGEGEAGAARGPCGKPAGKSIPTLTRCMLGKLI